MDPKAIFVTLEDTHDQIESAWTALAQQSGQDPRAFRRRKHDFGGPAYHLQAAEEACCRLYQQLVKVLPGAAALDSGDVTDSIVNAIEAPPVEQWNIGLPGGINGPFYSLVSSTGRVIAMQIPARDLAERIARLPELEAAKGAVS